MTFEEAIKLVDIEILNYDRGYIEHKHLPYQDKPYFFARVGITINRFKSEIKIELHHFEWTQPDDIRFRIVKFRIASAIAGTPDRTVTRLDDPQLIGTDAHAYATKGIY